MANKNYRTVKEALAIPDGKTIQDLSAKDLRDRLQTIVPVTFKREANLRKQGLDVLSTLPETKYRGKTRAELMHIFTHNKYWLEEVQSATVRGAKKIAKRTAENLGINLKQYKSIPYNEISKIFGEFHKLQELRPEWFVGKYSEDYLKTVSTEVLNGTTDITTIIDKLEKIRRKELQADEELFSDEDFGEEWFE